MKDFSDTKTLMNVQTRFESAVQLGDDIFAHQNTRIVMQMDLTNTGFQKPHAHDGPQILGNNHRK